MSKKTCISHILIAFGLFLSIAQGSTGNASNQTINTDKVENIVEITDIIEKEALKSVDFTQFSPLSNNINIIKDFSWSPDGTKLLVRTEVAIRTKNVSKEDKAFFARCSDNPFGVPEDVSSLFWINADGSELTSIARAEESIRAARNKTYAAIGSVESTGWNSGGDKIVFNIWNGCGGSGEKLHLSDGKGSVLAETNGSEFMQWSPDRNGVAILESEKEKSLISIIDARNSTIKQLSLNISIKDYFMIKWSPDGEKIAIIGNENIYMVNAYDFSVHQLTAGIKAKELSWKRDGTKLVFTAVDGLYIMDADGSNSTLIEIGNFNLVRWGAHWLLESWSSDGKKIVLRKMVNETEIFGKFYVLIIDGKATRLIAAVPDLGKYSSFVSWSPDGRKILFSKTDEKGKLDKLYVFDIESETTKLIASGLVAENVNPDITWSPDSKKIAYYSFGSKSIHTINPDGPGRVTPSESYYEYRWGLDNRIYSFINNSFIKLYPDGTERLPLIESFPSDDNWHRIYLSPDGSRILFASGNYSTWKERIYILKMKGYDEVMSINVPGSTKEGDDAFIEVKSMSKPVENATIFLNGSEIGKTNESGFLKYSFKEARNLKLSAAKQGFRTANKSITVEELPSEQSSPELALTATPQIAKPATVAVTPKAPGFDSVLTISILSTICLFKRRHN